MILLPAPPAQASASVTTTVLVTQSNWFWSGQATNIGGTGISPPSPLTDPTVPAGDLAVAGPQQNGQPSKESYLEFDVSAIPAGSTITSFTISLPVDPNGTNFAPIGSQAPIVACTPTNNWSEGPGAQSFSGKPKDRCATSAPKVTTRNGGKIYTADIAPIAQQWVQPGGNNFGVAITDDPQNTSTAYQAVFGPATAIAQLTASVTYSPPAAASGGGSASGLSSGGGSASGLSSGGGSASGFSSGGGSASGFSSGGGSASGFSSGGGSAS
ncbi:MAG: DNRLRE domain-containing protein, partial [Acidimicrobiales bacterium]